MSVKLKNANIINFEKFDPNKFRCKKWNYRLITLQSSLASPYVHKPPTKMYQIFDDIITSASIPHKRRTTGRVCVCATDNVVVRLHSQYQTENIS